MDPVGLWRSLAAGDRRKGAVVAASILLVALIAVMLAQLVWLVAVGPVSTVAEGATPAPVIVQAQTQRYSPEMAANWRLFGDAAAQLATTGPEDAPATNLSLQLLGTFSTGDTRLAGAVIAERGKDGELYRIGATLPGGAVLEKVEANKVLMRRRGQLETLSFDAAPTSAGGDAAAVSAAAGGVRGLRERLAQSGDDDGGDPDEPQSKARTVLAGLSESLRSNPEGVLSELGLRPVNANQASGYLLSDGSNSEMMRSLGLRPGDVVLSVNGKPLGSVRNDARLVDEVKASGEARVEIRRGSQTFTVNYPL